MRGLAAVALVVALAACSGTPAVSLPTPVPIPDGWITSASGGVRITIPAEWPSIGDMPHGVIVSVAIPPGTDANVGLYALSPQGLDQPELPVNDERLAEWILDRLADRQPDSYDTSAVALPAGQAIRIRYRFDGEPGSFEAIDGVAYAIRTAAGIAYLQVIVSASLVDRYATAMDQIPYLFELVADDEE